MEMHQVRYFLAVCEHLNFTRAAEHCHVAQPSLTRAIKLLEDELGGLLFHRERANTRLTELGLMVRPHLQEVFDRTQAVRREALDFGRQKRTTMRLGVMCTIAPPMLVELLTALPSKHPDMELHLSDGPAEELETRLKEGELDAAISADPNEPTDERLHRLSLFREQMMIVMPPVHRLANQPAIRMSDLDGECYISRIQCEFNGDERPAWDRCRWKTVYSSGRDDWVLAMVAAGIGFAFMPEKCISHPGVVARPLIEPEFWRDVALVTVRGRPHAPALGALVREATRLSWAGRRLHPA